MPTRPQPPAHTGRRAAGLCIFLAGCGSIEGAEESTSAVDGTEEGTSASNDDGPGTGGQPDVGSGTGSSDEGEPELMCKDGVAVPGEFCHEALLVPFVSQAVALGDLDGDLIDDFVAWTQELDLVWILPNGGTGMPHIDSDFATDFDCDLGLVPDRPHVDLLAIADANGDGLGDYIGLACDPTDPTTKGRIKVRMGDGNGSLAEPVFSALPGIPFDLEAADFNDDGRDDVAVVVADVDCMGDDCTPTCGPEPTSTMVMLALGDGHYGPPVEVSRGNVEVEVADLDDDGALDLVQPSRAWLGAGDGTFFGAILNPMDPCQTNGIATGQLVGEDTRVDVVQANKDGGTVIWEGDGSGGLTAHPPIVIGQANAVGVADVSADGQADILVVTETSLLHFVLAYGTVESHQSASQGLAIGRLNDDEVPDVVVVGGDAGFLSIHLSKP